jgi:3-phenylpropionate/trans-cinnamate dioxygenase ferredoxin subunit
MARHVVAVVGEIPVGGRKIVEVERRSIGIFNVGGEYFAVRNQCPHAGAPLCLGPTGGLVRSSAPGSYVYERAGEFLRCPWHHWEFDLRTGQSWFDPAKLRVRRYPVDVVPGSPEDVVDYSRARQPGPHVLERFPVHRDGDVIVIEMGRAAESQSAPSPRP